MRFSYIDSEGKEIEVDSVESLALRVELGAIAPDTRLYDAVADRWAPAKEHPVFRSLSRGEELSEEDVVPIGSEDGEEPSAPVPEPSSDDPLGLDFQVTMAEDEKAEVEPTEPAAEEEDEADAGLSLEGFEPFADEQQEASEPSQAPPDDEEEPAGPPSWVAEEAGLVWDDEAEADEAEEEEPETEASATDESAGLPEWIQEAPAWDEEEEEDEEEDVSASAAPEWESDPPGEERSKEPRRSGEDPVRPTHWDERTEDQPRREKIRKLVGTAVLAAVVGVAGAYVAGAGVFGGAGAGEQEVELEPLVPVLPPDLREALNAAGEEAWAEAVTRAISEQELAALPARPPNEWLDGVYLATAGSYPGVDDYWRGVGEVVTSVRSRARETFADELRERLDAAAGIAGERDRLLAVGIQEFELATPRREAAVQEVLAVVDASLDLHDLLVTREEDITYEPYTTPGVSRDPVLEAVPETDGLRLEMNTRLDRVLDAIEVSGLPRPITTRSMVGHLSERLREAGWRYRRPLQEE